VQQRLDRMSLQLYYRIVFWISLIGLGLLFFDFGFAHSNEAQYYLDHSYFIIVTLAVVATIIRYFQKPEFLKRKAALFDLILFSIFVLLIKVRFIDGSDDYYDEEILWIAKPIWIKFAVIFTFIREFAERRVVFSRATLNPAQLFIISYSTLIIFGALLLMLPNATTSGITFVDALFTATSAVCITGLSVLDVSAEFTTFGQVLLLALFQIGALGILTFASYFSYFFKGGASYENQLVLSEITSSDKISEVFTVFKQIIIITLVIELISAMFIFFMLDASLFETPTHQVFFAVFHAVSAFTNAGFSIVSDGFHHLDYRYNYSLHLVVIVTFIAGGLGFPIVANMVKYLRYKLSVGFSKNRRINNYRPWILSLNSRITLITTAILTVTGFILLFMTEFNNILAEHDGFGKVVTGLFISTTPRSAGLSSFDAGSLGFSSIMFILFLMWVGGAPVSTAGGIKTSTFAIATLNIFSLARGKDRIEVYRREISNVSVRRAFATISLSLIMIGLGIFVLSYLEPQMDIVKLTFECFSAYCTVGLSMGVTPDLSDASKIVVSLLMLIGRVSMLSIVIAVFKKVKQKSYRYPQESIMIN
jgi:trk system potassium uptake protein TrkH